MKNLCHLFVLVEIDEMKCVLAIKLRKVMYVKTGSE